MVRRILGRVVFCGLISEIDAPPLSKELKKRWSYFIRKIYETDPLICPKYHGEMWFDKLTTLRKLEGRIISFIDP